MAKGSKAQAQQAETSTAQAMVTYTGPQDFVEVQGVTLYRDQPVPMPTLVARRLRNKDNPYFEVAGVEAEKPEVKPEEAIEEERAKHKAEIEELKRLHSEEMERAAESLKAGWKEQHDDLLNQIDSLKVQLAGPQS